MTLLLLFICSAISTLLRNTPSHSRHRILDHFALPFAPDHYDIERWTLDIKQAEMGCLIIHRLGQVQGQGQIRGVRLQPP